MKISERYALEIGQIESDIELLKNRQIRRNIGVRPHKEKINISKEFINKAKER